MSPKHAALLTLLTVAGIGSSLSAQAPLAPPAVAPPVAVPAASAASTAGTVPLSAQDLGEAPDGAEINFALFFSQLSRYGRWVLRGDYGWVWTPLRVSADWRPYTLGHWALSDYGWTWISSEPFGWATYHYGRWIDDPDDGWLWLPGMDWGAAWVTWRAGDGYIGWAPLPPDGLDADYANAANADVEQDTDLPPGDFCFVDESAFLTPIIVTFILPPARNVTIFNHTTIVFTRKRVGNRLVNLGPPAAQVTQVTGQPVQAVKAPPIASGGGGGGGGRMTNGRVAAFRPITQAGRPTAWTTVRVTSVVGAGSVPGQSAFLQWRPIAVPPQQGAVASDRAPQPREPQLATDRQAQQQRQTELQPAEQRQDEERRQAAVEVEQQQRQATLQAEQQRQVAAQAEEQRQAALQAEQQRQAAAQAEEQQRQAALQAEQQRQAAVQAEQQRQAAMQAEQQRQAALQAEQQRQAAVQAEQQRQAAMQAEQQRQAAMQAEQQRQAAVQAEQQRQAAMQAEQQRQAEQQAQQQRQAQGH